MTLMKDLMPIYSHKPYVIINKYGVVLLGGTLNELIEINNRFCGYYDDCEIKVREYDLFCHDNTKIKKESNANYNKE
jgi:hypothetical protein